MVETIAEYEAWKKRQQEAGVGMAQVVLNAGIEDAPDSVAEDLKIGEEYARRTGGVTPPRALVKAEKPVFQKAIERAKAGTILSSSPTLTEWLRDPDNAAVGRDDLENLSWWDGLGNALNRGVMGVDQSANQLLANTMTQRYGDRSKSFMEIWQEQRAQVGAEGAILDTFTGPITDLYFAGSRYLTARLDEVFGDDTEAKAAFYQQRSAEISERIAAIPMTAGAEAVRQKLGGIGTSGEWQDQLGSLAQVIGSDPVGFASFLTQTAVEFAPELAAMAAVTAATRNPTAGALFLGGASATVSTGSQSLEFVKDAGHDLATPEGALAAIRDPGLMAEAARRGALYGLTVGAIDAFSGGVAGQALAKTGVGNLVLQMLVQAGLGGVGEAAGQIASGQPMNWVDVVVEAMAEFVTAPVEVATFGGSEFVRLRKRAEDAETRKAVFQELSGQAVNSKLRARLPDRFKRFLETATQDGPVEKVFVPAEAFIRYFQGVGVDPYDLAGSLDGVTREDLETAEATGGDLMIPTATYAARIAGTEHDVFFADNMKFDPSEFTSTEAAEFNARAEDALQEAYDLAEQLRHDADELRSAEQEIYDVMVSRLREAGRATDVATTEAMLYPAFYRTMAERSGVSTAEFVERYPLPQVRRAAPEALQVKNVDALTRTLTEARNRKKAGLVDRGASLLEFIAERGGIDDRGGELKARDAEVIKRGRGKKTLRVARKGVIAGIRDMLTGQASTSNYGPDDVIRAAVESGYLANDPTVIAWQEAQRNATEAPDLVPVLWAAIDRELRGEPEYADDGTATAEDADLDQIEEYLAALGLSLADDDQAIREALEQDQAASFGSNYGQGSGDVPGEAFKRSHTLYQFAGRKSETADLFQLDEAKRMLAEGKSAAVVRRETGWFKGADRRWRYEISDDAAMVDGSLLPPLGSEGRRAPPVLLGDLLQHDRLYAAYPDLQGVTVHFDPDIQSRGQVDGFGTITLNPRALKDAGDVLSTLLHEVQHIIQQREGFARGGNLEITEKVKSALGRLVSSREYSAEQWKAENEALFQDAEAKMAMLGYVQLFQEFDRLVDYANHPRPSSLRRHILGSTNWFYAPIFQNDPDLRSRATELSRRLYEMPKRHRMAERNRFLGDYAFAVAQLFRDAVPAEVWQSFKEDKRQLRSMVAAFERDARGAREKLKPYADVKSRVRQARELEESARHKSPFEVYQALAGEVEARNTQARASMTDEERRATGPESTADVGGNETIVIYHDGEIEAPFIANDSAGPVRGDLLFQSPDVMGFGGGPDPRGSIAFGAGGDAVISLFQRADLSTFVHESGHYFLRVMQQMAAADAAGPIARDFAVVKDWWLSHADDVAKDASTATGTAITGDDVRAAIGAGTSGDVAKDAAIDVGMQEQFARGLEQYLMEGKAPSLDLRRVFEKFRAWLVSIYRRAVGLNVEISDAMRGVFDRLLATDAELDRAKQEAGAAATPIFATAEEMGLTPDQFEAFKKLFAQGEDEANARLLAEIMTPIRRAATEAYKAERKRVRAEVERTMKASPLYRAVQELRFGRTHDGEDVPPVKLSREAIEKDYGAGYLSHLPGATKDGHGHRNAVFASEGGVHPDVVAGTYGFATGRDLLDALANAPDLRDAIDAETDRIMRELHNDPALDGSIPQVALDALHNDKRGQALAVELKALAEIVGVDRGLSFKDARESARRTLRQMRVRDAIRADRFLAAERKAGQEATKLAAQVTREQFWMDAARRRVAASAKGAVKAGDPAVARGVAGKVDKANRNTALHNKDAERLVEAKRRQLLNHMLYAEARKVATETDKLTERMAKLNRPDAKQAKARNVDYVKAARAVAARFGLARAERDFDFARWIEQLRYDDPVSADAISEAIATYSQNARPYKDLTVAELGAVKDAIDSLLETGRRSRLLEIEGAAVERDLAISELRDIIDMRAPSENVALKRKLNKFEKVKVQALSVASSLRRMEHWAREMDEGKAGPFTRYLVKPVMDAVDLYRNDRAGRLRALLAILNPRRDELLGKAIAAPELGYTFENKGELLHAILHTGNESNLEKLLLGRGWSGGLVGQTQKTTAGGKPSVTRKGDPIMTRGRVDTSKWDAFMERMVAEGVVTKADYDTAQAVWDLMDEIKRPAQSAHRKVYGYYFEEVEPRAIETPFGSYRGGYVPAIADMDASNDGQIRADQEAFEQQQSSFMFPTTGAGFTKSRVQHYHTPLALNLMLLPAHMDKVLRFTHLNPVIRQTAGLVTKGELRTALDQMDRSIVADLITPWLQRTAQQAVESQSATPAGRAASAFFRAVRTRVGLNVMFANLVNTLQQVTGLSSAMILVKPGRMKAALARFTLGGANDMRREASEASAFMRDRITNAGRDLTGRVQEAIVKPNGLDGFRAFIERHGYFMQQGAQNVVDVIAWHAAYDQAIAGGVDQAAAVFEADSVIRRTMGDFSPENVSKFETGPAFIRLFTMFYSYFNGQANLMAGEAAAAMRSMGWGAAGRLFWIYLFGMAIPAIVGEGIVQGFRGELGDEDDDGYLDDIAELFFGSQARYLAGMVPVAGPIVMGVVNRFNNQFYDDRLSTSPVISTVERAVSAPASVLDAATGDGRWSRATADALIALGLITGIPTGQLARLANWSIRQAEGE